MTLNEGGDAAMRDLFQSLYYDSNGLPTHEVWDFTSNDSRTAIWIRFCQELNLDPIQIYEDWRVEYKLDDTRINALLNAMVSSDDDSDYFNFELHGTLRACLFCDETIDWNELFVVDSYPVCLRCAPEQYRIDDEPHWYQDEEGYYSPVATFLDLYSYEHGRDFDTIFTG